MNDTTRIPLIELDKVSKVYQTGGAEVRALDHISLTIHEGEYVAIMGQSGSGKSTLMNILGCLDRPSEGSYRVRGTDIAELTSDELANLRRNEFGFVFQRYNLLATMTAAENVELPAIYAGLSQEARRSRSLELLGLLGMGNRARHRPNELSGGQQQRVSIARALMNDANVVLADEPTGALDTRSGAEVLEVLDKLNRDGRTVILITHEPEVAAHAHRQIVISDGHIISDSGTADVTGPEQAHVIREHSHLALWAEVSEAVKMAIRSLRANIFRTALTLLGVVIGVAAVVTMLAIGDGSKANILQSMQSMGTNLLLVRPGAPGMRPTGDIATLTPADATAIEQNVPNVVAVAPERDGSETARFGNIDYRTQVTGTWPQYTKVRDWDAAKGSFFSEADLESYAPVAVLGQTVVDNLFPDGKDPVGQYVLIGNIPFEVIGVMEAKGASSFGRDQDDVIFLPITTGFMRLFGQQYANSINVKVSNSNLVDQTQADITKLLLARHQTEDFQIRNTASMLETMESMSSTLTILLGSVAGISLLVGGIGVMNIMLVNVTERTREIGLRMATGARMNNILLQFNTEALVVCGVGGLIGVMLGIGTGLALGSFGLHIAINPLPSFLAFSCAFMTGLIFGYLPARKAARLDPVVALASE